VVAHADRGFPVRVGERVSVGHRAVLHGCSVGDDSLIGMGSVLMNGVRIGAGSLVAAGSGLARGGTSREGATAPDCRRGHLHHRQCSPVPGAHEPSSSSHPTIVEKLFVDNSRSAQYCPVTP
jgi:hypothetical protein